MGSNPRRTTIGTLVQLVEHLPCKQGVIGSSPIRSTNILGTVAMGPAVRYRKTLEQRVRRCESITECSVRIGECPRNIYSVVVQLVEHPTVNRVVSGPSPLNRANYADFA